MDLVFWSLALGLAALVATVLLRAVLAAPAGTGPVGQEADLRVYRDQLAELDRDLARGAVEPEEGARLRAEIARRLLLADRTVAAQPNAAARGASWPAALLVLGLLVAAGAGYGFWLGSPGLPDLPLAERLALADEAYRARPSQAEMEAAAPPQGALPADPAEAKLLEDLRAAVAGRPDDAQGHALLARTEASVGNMAGAAAAFARVITLRGAGASADEHAQLAELMIVAAGGAVSPEAEAQLVLALQKDPGHGPARYYTGLMMAQLGRPDRAFALWRQLVDEGPADAPWIAPVRAGIEALADAAGIRYSLPQAQAPGPDAEALGAAAEMTEEERQAMIAGMVGGLEERLMSDGGSAEEWARLISALQVLGEEKRAGAAVTAARAALAQDAEALKLLDEAAAGTAP
ncbi:MAG: c-type cytochrome biogenesis protein CcmI [Paracoccaceae bacterium]